MNIVVDKSGISSELVRKGLFIVIFLFGGMMVWGYYAPINGAVVASGTIKVDFNRKVIQHLEGGIIKEILVREGSEVKANQPMLVLEDVSTSSQYNILTDRYWSARVKEARYNAQKYQLEQIKFPPDLLAKKSGKIKELIQNETDLYYSIITNYHEHKKLLSQQIRQIEEEIASRHNEIRATQATIAYLNEQLQINTELKKDGYIEQTKIWDVKTLLAEKKERISSHHASIAMAKAKVTGTRLQINTLENDFRQQAEDKLKETQKEIHELTELLRPAKNAYERSIVLSPLDGQVINLKVNTIGGVVKPGQEILEIVPKENELIIEVKVKPNDIDNIYIGQKTFIQLQAYNSRTTPLLIGSITYISADVLDDPIDRGQYFYLSHVKVNKKDIENLDANIKLFPGMPVTAFIQTRSRTFLDYLLEPITEITRRAFREE